jgi:hypothetical protein
MRTTQIVTMLLLAAPLRAQRPDTPLAAERRNVETAIAIVEENLVSAADAMPADKYGFAPRDGEFANVRTFGKQVRHLSAANFILAAAALGRTPPDDAGDETGPDSVITKAQHLAYLRRSFAALREAAAAIGDPRVPVRASPISPFQGDTPTRLALVVEALVHAYDHYGQMVVYLRMNGVVPPASRR